MQEKNRSRGLTSELLAVDGLSTGAVALGEITSLEHERWNHTVEAGSLITVAILTSGELTEVAGGLGNDVIVELEHDAASGGVVDGDVELK